MLLAPKGLLHDKRLSSPIAELVSGRFEPILGDARLVQGGDVRRVLLCSGRVYHDLDAYRQTHGRDDVAILRVEQLYPLTAKDLGESLAAADAQTPILWVQEEPENMGAWVRMRVLLERALPDRPWRGVTREEAPSPATGSSSTHRLEQEQLVCAAFA